jgi:hypothetical protein
VNKENKFYLEADIKIEKETSILKEKASKVIDLPEGEDKQPDLQYFSAVFVSSGENLNHAYFMPSELVLAENTIVNKALDIEHQESQIILLELFIKIGFLMWLVKSQIKAGKFQWNVISRVLT